MSPDDDLAKVVAGVHRDPVITFMLKCGPNPQRAIYHDVDDHLSKNYAVFLWNGAILVLNLIRGRGWR
ncbi:hypothetical protein J2S00_001032 [Caldalkalibacillus uzonensis]|uniref:Uncharacterized protein n=1 Tax=Caldalkalibacillus uzonensis TaxID=353224 RepID=A0ABU0CPA7_9BACI|nr:hypothetical protein [Caldalkalibacillus uzonensis]